MPIKKKPTTENMDWNGCTKCAEAWTRTVGLSNFCSSDHYSQFKRFDIERRRAYAAKQQEALKNNHSEEYLTACDLLAEKTEECKRLRSQLHHAEKQIDRLKTRYQASKE